MRAFPIASLLAAGTHLTEPVPSGDELSCLAKRAGMKRRQYKKLWKLGRLPEQRVVADAVLDVVDSMVPLFSMVFGVRALMHQLRSEGGLQ